MGLHTPFTTPGRTSYLHVIFPVPRMTKIGCPPSPSSLVFGPAFKMSSDTKPLECRAPGILLCTSDLVEEQLQQAHM